MNYQLYSNQQVINAFYYAVRKLNFAGPALDAWDLIVQTGLESIADQRRASYNCPPIDQLGLTPAVAQAIIDELAAMTPQFQNDPASQPDILLGVPWVSQLDQNSPDSLDCGHACVLMLLKYYDNPPSPIILSDTTVNDLVELMRVIDVQKGRPRRPANLTTGRIWLIFRAQTGCRWHTIRSFQT